MRLRGRAERGSFYWDSFCDAEQTSSTARAGSSQRGLLFNSLIRPRKIFPKRFVMAAATLVSLSEYLITAYRPDRDYIDGELKERNVGEQPHGDLQMILGTIFRNNRLLWGVRPAWGHRL